MFRDRQEVGESLAQKLLIHQGNPDTLILGVPRGGVVVGAAIARRLKLSLDVFISQRLRAPWSRDVALGAVTETGSVYVNPEFADSPVLPPRYMEEETRHRGMEALWLRRLFRGGRELPHLARKTVLLVDDAAVSGSTLLAALQVLRRIPLRYLAVGVGLAAKPLLPALREWADEVIALETPERVVTCDEHFADLKVLQDPEVAALLSVRKGVPGQVRRA